MPELMIEDPSFVEDERKAIDSKDSHFIMVIAHSSEQVDRDNMLVKVHIEADLDILLPHDEEYKDDYFPVSAAISQCRNHIISPMGFYPTMGCAV